MRTINFVVRMWAILHVLSVGCTWVTTHVLFSQWLALRVTFSLGEYSYAYIIVDRITEQYVALDDI